MRTIVALVGAAGHLGRELRRQLAPACDVRPVGPGAPAGPEALAGADVVLHLDTRVSIADGADPLGPVDTSTVDALLRACTAGRLRRLVHVSSLPALVPGRAATSDELVRRAAAAGVDVVAVHPTGIIGPGDPGPGRLNRLLLDVWHRRRPAPVGGGLDWVDVRDVAAGTIAAASSAPAGGRYLLGGHWATVEDVLARATRIAAEVRTGLASGLALDEPPLGVAATTRDDDPFDAALARRDLGYTSRPLESTLRDTLEWFAATDLVRLGDGVGHLVPA